MNILALDLGTKTGFALLDEGQLESGTVVFDVKRGESAGMRYIRFNRWLATVALHISGPPRVGLIVYEAAHQRGGAATEIAAGFTTRVQEFCAARGIEHASVHTATLKKWTTGNGHAKKPEMIAAVSERWKKVTDDDEADAIALLYHALAEVIER
jgi:Holliday junction resolvasome RuvABC endonuclease subunit